MSKRCRLLKASAVVSRVFSREVFRSSYPALCGLKAPQDKAVFARGDLPYAGKEMAKILVVDDQALLSAQVGKALKGNYAVLGAMSAEEGLGLAVTERPDLIVLDVHLPDGNGIDVCRKIRFHPEAGIRTIPVLLVSGEDSSDTRIRGLDAGADDFLAKPFSPDELRARIEASLRRARRS